MDFLNKHNDMQWGSFGTYRFLRKVTDFLQYMLDVLGLFAFPLQSPIIAIEMRPMTATGNPLYNSLSKPIEV